jgi:hypothetical protein
MRQRLLVTLLLVVSTVACLYTLASIYGLVPSRATTTSFVPLAPDALRVASPPPGPLPAPLRLGLGSSTDPSLNPAIASSLHAAGVSLLRFGDVYADDFDWQHDCVYGDIGTRAECYGPGGQGGKLDQFLAFAGGLHAQPLVVVNGEIDDPQQAANEVAYYWRHCAHQSGRPCLDPYWEIGDSPAAWRHFAVPLRARGRSDAVTVTPDQYAALVVSYAAAMARATPYYLSHQIKIVASEWITGATDESWISTLSGGGVDTHYAPMLYAPPGPAPSTRDILQSLEQGSSGRPGIDLWLRDVRDSLAQFSQSGSIKIMVGRWSIDGNAGLYEPAVYGSYTQALFAAALFAHLWQDSQAAGANPLLMAIQAPLAGQAQEPFDLATSEPRAVVAVYALINRYFQGYPLSVQRGAALARENILAAGVRGERETMLLIVNEDTERPQGLMLEQRPRAGAEWWWVAPDSRRAAGVSAVRHASLSGERLLLPAGAIAVVRLPA